MTFKRVQAEVIVLVIILLTLLIAYPLQAEEPSYTLPGNLDRNSNYLFFFHNYYVEANGTDGDCKYYDLLRKFAIKGFTVVSQLRNPDSSTAHYVNKTAEQIQSLLNAGVPPANITVCGHSKGGVIALNVAALLQQPEINYLILAGCEIAPLGPMYPDPLQLKGSFLSLYAKSDKIATSCIPFLSSTSLGVSTKEVVLDSTKGHRLFFEPDIIWLTHIEPTFCPGNIDP